MVTVDLRTLIDAAATIAAVFLTVWAQRKFERRARLVVYFGPLTSVPFVPLGSPPETQPTFFNSHTVVLRNAGQVRASNVRLRHHVLPSFSIWPPVQHHIEDLPGVASGREIVIPALLANEEITVSYLYSPPLLATQISAGIVSDDGFAEPIQVLLRPPYPRWVQRSARGLLVVGLVTVVYMIAYALTMLVRHWPF